MYPEGLPAVVLWSLPALFAVHDAEEILRLPGWLRRNREALSRRFPGFYPRLSARFDHITPCRFAAMAAEELALLLAATAWAFLAGDYRPWLALYLAFALHLVVHVVQWALLRRYIPVIATALLCLPCCSAGMCVVWQSGLFSVREWMVCAVAGCGVAAINLLLLHAAVARRGRSR